MVLSEGECWLCSCAESFGHVLADLGGKPSLQKFRHVQVLQKVLVCDLFAHRVSLEVQRSSEIKA